MKMSVNHRLWLHCGTFSVAFYTNLQPPSEQHEAIGGGGCKKSEGKPELTATLYGLHLVNTQFSGSVPISQITQSQ